MINPGHIALMGVLNLTPDSFSASSRIAWRSGRPDPDDCLRRMDGMLSDGADIIDLGACSTRPGSVPVPMEEEWRRLSECLGAVRREGGDALRISVDTFHAEIVRRAFDTAGDILVNDVSGAADPQMLPVVSSLGLEYVATHSAGGIVDVVSGGIVEAVDRYFTGFAARLSDAGLSDRWLLDPGLGFSKDIPQNWELLRNLGSLQHFARPILVGFSDKRMVRGEDGLTSPRLEQEALRLSLLGGASVIRVHNVADIRKMINFVANQQLCL